jgi:hypothetical protein
LRRGTLTVVFLLLAGAGPGRAEPGTFADSVAPVFEHNCYKCHGATKQKAGLRLDSLEAVLRGSDEGEVVKPGNSSDSELFRRITLPPGDEDIMPSGGSSPLSPAEISVLQSWIAAGAPSTDVFEAARQGPAAVAPPAAPDYRPRLAHATELARTLGVRLVPRSSVPTDGLVLRTASAPAVCDDAVLAKLAPVADIIVEAELARTRVTDTGLEAVGHWTNLVRLDLTHTAVTSDGVARLASLTRLETLNLTATKVDSRGVALAKKLPVLKSVWAFGTP